MRNISIISKAILFCAVLILSVCGVTQAAMKTYNIVDYPTYQVDTTTGLTDHVSGIIVADPTTGIIESASFTITGADSFTVASAVIDAYYIHISDTQITLTPDNPSNSLNYGNLRLSGSTGVSGSNSTAVLQWYTPGNPWVAGSNNWAAYMGTVGSKGSGPLFASDHDATGFTTPVTGSRDTMVVATVVPEPATICLLVLGSVTLMKRRKA